MCEKKMNEVQQLYRNQQHSLRTKLETNIKHLEGTTLLETLPSNLMDVAQSVLHEFESSVDLMEEGFNETELLIIENLKKKIKKSKRQREDEEDDLPTKKNRRL